MASANVVSLYNANVTASVNSNPQDLRPRYTSFIGWLDVSSHSSGTFDVKIQHSPDKTNWKDLATFTQATGDTTELKQITDNVFVYVRAEITAASSPDADVKVQLWYDSNR